MTPYDGMEFGKLAGYWERIEAAASRLEMTSLLGGLLRERETDAAVVSKVIYLCQGQIAPGFKGYDIGLGEKLVEEALAMTSGYAREEVGKRFQKLGDLGLVAQEIAEKKRQQSLFREKLSVEKVYDNFLRIAKASGHGSQEQKLKLLAELLNSASPLEAKFVTRIPLGAMRLGIGDPTLMDALAVVYSKEFLAKEKRAAEKIEAELKEKKEEKRGEEFERRVRQLLRERIEEKYNIHSDLGDIARLLKEKGLKGLDAVELTPGVPIRPTLAERLPSAGEIVEKLGECMVEGKFDGFRLQVHKREDEVSIFSRRSENVTPMFPEVIEGVKTHLKARTAIIEGEALAVNEETGEFFPFQVTIQRKRKHGIERASEELPLKLFAFDVMMVDGKNLMPLPFRERRKTLERIVERGGVLDVTPMIVTKEPEAVDAFFTRCIEQGLEGIVAKDLDAKYIAGARKFAWIKLKRSYKGELQDSVDLAVIGYFKGKGIRTRFGLGALLAAAYNGERDCFESIAKIGTGLSEAQLAEWEERLKKIKANRKPARVESGLEPDVWTEPVHVIEVRADEITRSPVHACGREAGKPGYALRFPRLVSFRTDKKAEEATSTKEIRDMFARQKAQKTQESGKGDDSA